MDLDGSFTPTLLFTAGLADASGDLAWVAATENDSGGNPVSRMWAEYSRRGNIVNMCFCIDAMITFSPLAGKPDTTRILNVGGFPAEIRPGRDDGTSYGTGIGSCFFSADPSVPNYMPGFEPGCATLATVVTPTLNAMRFQGFKVTANGPAVHMVKASHLVSGRRYYMRGNATYYTNGGV